MFTLGIILARAGSKGLREKCVRPLLGRALIEFTFDHALASRRLDDVVLSTDHPQAKSLARGRKITVIDRPPILATDSARVDQAARHALFTYERHGPSVDAVVLLYGNIPIRPDGAIDRAIDLLESSGADSVRTVCPVGKFHPDWMFRLNGDSLTQYRENNHYRRQDLEPVFSHDGAVVAVRRESLLAGADSDNAQAFWGQDRRGLPVPYGSAVDVDEPADLWVAEAVLRAAGQLSETTASSAGVGQS